METYLNIFGTVLIFLGIVVAAGSAGDCDGKCMELANPIWLMLLLVAGSIVSMGLGAVMLIQAGSK